MASSLSVFRNASVPGTISFAPRIDITPAAPGGDLTTIKLIDVDGDGKLDLVGTCGPYYYIMMRNNSTPGNISFAAPVSMPVSDGQGSSLFMANLNGDAKPDYWAIGLDNEDGSIMRNVSTPGNIAFDGATFVGPGAYYAASGDFDGDGKPDIVTSNAVFGTTITIFKNNMGASVVIKLCQNSSTQVTSDVIGTATYQWQQDAGSGFFNIGDTSHFSGTATQYLTLTNVPLSMNGYRYRCIIDGNRYSSIFTIQVNGVVIPSITWQHADSVICPGATANFIASSQNAISPYYNWLVNGSAQTSHDSTFLSSSLVNGDYVSVIVTSEDICSNFPTDTSGIVTMHISGTQLIHSTLSASDTSICIGTPVMFRVQVTDTVSRPFFQWQVNGGNTGGNADSLVLNTLADKDQVQVIVSATSGCWTPAPSNTVTIDVATGKTISADILAFASTVCSGSPVTLRAQLNDTVSHPLYQWKVNGVVAGTNTDSLSLDVSAGLSQVTLIVSASAGCWAPGTSTINLTGQQAAVPQITVDPSPDSVCSGKTVVYTATISGTGAPVNFSMDEERCCSRVQ